MIPNRARRTIAFIFLAGAIVFPGTADCVPSQTAPREVELSDTELWIFNQLHATGHADLRENKDTNDKTISADFFIRLLTGDFQGGLPPIVKVTEFIVQGDVSLDGRVITQHIYVCGAQFKGHVNLNHVTANGSIEICNSVFHSPFIMKECDLSAGVRFANNVFQGGFEAHDCSFKQYFRIIGPGSYPSASFKLQDVSVATTLEFREGSFENILFNSIDANAIVLSKVVVIQNLLASELTITKRLLISDVQVQGDTVTPTNVAGGEYNVLFSDVFVGTTARFYRNKFSGKAGFLNLVVNSILAYDGSEFLSNNHRPQFRQLNCSVDCSFADATFHLGLDLNSVYVANQLIFRDTSFPGDQALAIEDSNVNGTALLNFKTSPRKVSLIDSSFKVLKLQEAKSDGVFYSVDGMDFERITMEGESQGRWALFMRNSAFSEPFSTRLRNFLLEDGQKAASDMVRVQLKRHKRAEIKRGSRPWLRDHVYDGLLEYGTRPWDGLLLFPIIVFALGLLIYRRSQMEYNGRAASEPHYWSAIYTTHKLIPFFYLPELEGWKPRTHFGWFYLLSFPMAQLSLGVFLAHYAFEQI